MAETKRVGHTPGPWTAPTTPYQDIRGDGPNFSGGDWEVLPPLGEAGPVAIAATEANARLIAAAPDLLEAARHAAMEWRLHGQLTDSCRVLEAAIAKATEPDHA